MKNKIRDLLKHVIIMKLSKHILLKEYIKEVNENKLLFKNGWVILYDDYLEFVHYTGSHTIYYENIDNINSYLFYIDKINGNYKIIYNKIETDNMIINIINDDVEFYTEKFSKIFYNIKS